MIRRIARGVERADASLFDVLLTVIIGAAFGWPGAIGCVLCIAWFEGGRVRP